MNKENLLQRFSDIMQRYKGIYRKTGEKFNMFQVLGIESKEVYICRVMRELLSPSGSHYQGILFLRAFVRDVLDLTTKSLNMLKSTGNITLHRADALTL